MDKIYDAAEKPGPVYMEVSMDMILEGESFVLRKTNRNEYDIFRKRANLTYRIIAAMMKLGDKISVARKHAELLDRDREYFFGYDLIDDEYRDASDIEIDYEAIANFK